jgi:hypothetical protein
MHAAPGTPQPHRVPRRAGVETRQVLLMLGALCLIVAFTAGTALVWSALGPSGQFAVMVTVTIALLAGAATLRRLTATAEALAAVGFAGCVVDAIAARTLHLTLATGLTTHAYVAAAAITVTAAAFTVGCANRRLTAAPLVWATSPLVAAVAAVNPHGLSRTALLTPIGIVTVAGLDHALRRSAAPSTAARIVNAANGTVVAAIGYAAALLAAAAHDPVALWGLTLPVALFGLPVIAGQRRWVTEAATAAMAGVTASSMLMAAGATASQQAKAQLAVALLVLPVYLLALEGGDWLRRAQVTAGSFAVAGGSMWLSSAGLTQQFANVNFALAFASAGVAVVWPRSRANVAAVRWAALSTATVLLSMAVDITLVRHDVATIEAYFATPFGIALGAGAGLLARNRQLPSVVLVPGLVGFLPTLLMALGHDHQRQAILLVAAALLVCIGAELRLATPLAAGAGVVALLALRLAGPELAVLPKWELFAAVGAVLLTLGATWDARLADIRKARAALGSRIAALR